MICRKKKRKARIRNSDLAQADLRDPKKDPEQTDFGEKVKAQQYEICTEYRLTEIYRNREAWSLAVLMHTPEGAGEHGLMV